MLNLFFSFIKFTIFGTHASYMCNGKVVNAPASLPPCRLVYNITSQVVACPLSDPFLAFASLLHHREVSRLTTSPAKKLFFFNFTMNVTINESTSHCWMLAKECADTVQSQGVRF